VDDKPKSRGAGGKFLTGHDVGVNTRWQPGQSGNPLGKPARQVQFDQALADALTGDDPEARANELAELVWKSARAGEPWAVQMLFARLSPQPLRVRMETDKHGDRFDYSRLSDAELDALEQLLLKCEPAGQLESGAGQAASEDVH
jgi:hypothetical protein